MPHDDTDMLKCGTTRRRQNGAAGTFHVRQKGPHDEYVMDRDLHFHGRVGLG